MGEPRKRVPGRSLAGASCFKDAPFQVGALDAPYGAAEAASHCPASEQPPCPVEAAVFLISLRKPKSGMRKPDVPCAATETVTSGDVTA